MMSLPNITLAHPWLLLALPLPLLVWWLLPPHREPRRSLVVPFLNRLADLTGQHPGHGSAIAPGSLWRSLVVIMCWLLVVTALARPQYIEPPISQEIPVRDMLLAVDLSGSMETRDFTNEQGETIDRLTAVKSVLDDFLSRRQGDRVGLIFFGSAAFVQAPFTEDLEVCRELLDEAQVRMAGPQTALGDALGLAINTFERSTVKERVLIALTDGNDTSSQVPPAKAAQIARDRGIVIHTVAVGDPGAVGEDALDEATLKDVASSTGGLYSHAGSREQLQAIYQQLDELETQKVQTVSHRPRRDIFWWPLLAALLLSMAYSGAEMLRLRFQQGRQAHAGAASPATLASAAPAALLALPGTLHLIRPAALLLLLPACLLWWLLRRSNDAGQAWRGIIAPHLLQHLLSVEDQRSRFGPLAWLGLAWLVSVLAIAGPAFKQQPAPFADDTAALAVVISVTPSMETEDLQPSRLQRASMKLHDLLQTRGNAKTALVAYAGSAHRVMPATHDAGIIDTFARSLSPEIMPQSGDAAAAALRLADQSLAEAGGGSIVWITDSVAAEQAAALAEWRRSSSTPVRLWPPLLAGDERDALVHAASPADARLVEFTADDTDVLALASAAKFAPAMGSDSDPRWADAGYWLTPLLVLLTLMFIRRGFRVTQA